MMSSWGFHHVVVSLGVPQDHFCMSRARHCCQILTKIGMGPQFFVKYRSIKFHENSSSGSQVVTCDRRTDRHSEENPGFAELKVCATGK
jgi:hypothetical protein